MRLTVSGNAGGCVKGDQVEILSHAFKSKTSFAGVPDVLARVRSAGAFSARARVAHVKPGRYAVSARCGGGNLGVHATLRVT